MSDNTWRDAAASEADESYPALGAREDDPVELFTPRELRRLLFMRWLYRKGLLTEFPEMALDCAA